MSQLDYLAAQSIAHERERDLQLNLRQRANDRPGGTVAPTTAARGHHWFHDTLVHLHLMHAPTH